MKIAVTSQNFRTVTAHAGKCRRFMLFDTGDPRVALKVGRLDLPLEMSMHEFKGEAHPLDEMDVIITGSAGQGFMAKMAKRGVKVVVCSETDPAKAVNDFLDGKLKHAAADAALNREHSHDECGCQGHVATSR